MQLLSLLYVFAPLCLIEYVAAFQCASWVPADVCSKSAQDFSAKIRTMTMIKPQPTKAAATAAAFNNVVRAAAPPPTKNCGGRAMMDDVIGCSGPYLRASPRPSVAQPTTLSTVAIAAPSPAVTERML